MATKIPFAFASAGDTENVPASSAGTELSWLKGWSPAYELNPTDPGYRFISRGQHNFLWNAITANVKEWQEQIYPAHNSTIEYPVGSIVRFNNANYIRTAGAGVTADPSASVEWSIAGQFTSADKTQLDAQRFGTVYDRISRVPDVVYTNNKSYPILVHIVLRPSSGTGSAAHFVYEESNINLAAATAFPGSNATFSFIIPAGKRYRLIAPAAQWAITSWSELV